MNLSSDEQSIFAEALALAAGPERVAYLDRACGANADLRRRLEEVLRSADEAGSFLESPALGDVPLPVDTRVIAAAPEKPGDQIGRYRLLQAIGEGGCGVVYMAEQEQPVRRKVALKVIKLGMDTRTVIARFELERQALALMDHPNIAKVLDAGSTATGRPYFVMELVRGVRITDYCDQARLDIPARLELFIQVCHAVQHAHQKGIIHRDLKPSNILVTLHDGVPMPKVIDFGIAKATTGQRLTEKTLFTAYEQFLGTPAYMSPEQAEMSSLDVDTRTDIYSLGVLLYELLTGRTPFSAEELMSEGLEGMRRTIREREPMRPSTRLGTMVMAEAAEFARGRREPVGRLASLIRGDLDWIVMRALEKDRSRRYETATSLALDVRRHLSCETVSARPPSTVYRVQKAFRRNKLMYLSVAAVFAALAAGLGLSVWQGLRATREGDRARRALEELRSTAPAFAEQARALVAQERFDEAIEKLDYASKLRPDDPAYGLMKANLLQAQMRMAEALAAYQAVLAVAPGHPRAATNAALCALLLAAPSDQGALSRESLALLHRAMESEQRPAAELMPVSRRLGTESKNLVAYWLERLRGLPLPASAPLKDRLVMRETGRLALDLSETSVVDLSPLAGMPLGWLSLEGCAGVREIGPLRGAPLRTLILTRTAVEDLGPIRSLEHLETLDLGGTPVRDLSPLAGKALKFLNLSGCPHVHDLAALRGLPLKSLYLRTSRIQDLEPIRGMPLKLLDLTQASVIDFSPLRGLQLECLVVQSTRIRDLGLLQGMPLRELQLSGCKEVRGLETLSTLTNLEILSLPVEYRGFPEAEQASIAALRGHPRLRQIVVELMDGMNLHSGQSSASFWRDWDREQLVARPLRAAGLTKFILHRLNDDTYALSLDRQPVKDLAMLPADAPISILSLVGTQVRDLSPVSRFPLRRLELTDSPVSSLEPLRAGRLEEVYLSGTRVTNLSALASHPLKAIYLMNTPVTDLSPLAGVRTLESILLPAGAVDVEMLRGLPALRRISFHPHPESALVAETAAEFWSSAEPVLKLGRELRAENIRHRFVATLDRRWDLDINDPKFTDPGRLRGIPLRGLGLDRSGVRDLTALRDTALEVLEIRETPVQEFPALEGTALAGALKELRVSRTAIRDLAPLAACRRLELLDAGNTRVTNLAPVSALPLQRLYLSGAPVTDLQPILGLPLRTLFLDRCAGVTNVGALSRLTRLRELLLPEAATGLGELRALTRLERVGFQWKYGVGPNLTAKEFWKAYDARAEVSSP